MPRRESVLSVCKHCGAVGSIKQPHCVFCGATLKEDMQVRIEKYQDKADTSKGGKIRKKVTAESLIALLFGIVSVLMLAFLVFDCGFLFSILAIALAIVSLCQRKGGGLLAAFGIGLGLYTVFVNSFWFFFQFLYLF